MIRGSPLCTAARLASTDSDHFCRAYAASRGVIILRRWLNNVAALVLSSRIAFDASYTFT
jgi:hypothetical protein